MCTIAVDYDGTITANFQKARQALRQLMDQGHKIVIWSSRNNPEQHGADQGRVFNEMMRMLKFHDIPYNRVDIGDVGKFHAQVYIDDKCWRFENNWNDIVEKIF